MTREEAKERFNGIINAMSISTAQSKFYPSKAELNELCDIAIEALSAGAEWIPCDTSDMQPEGEAVLMSDGKHIWIDETVAWWGDRSYWIGTAWMPLPKPYKGGDTSNCTTEKPNDEVEQGNDIIDTPTDLISRADAIEAVEDGMCTFYDCDVLDRINAVPSADRPSGEWVYKEADPNLKGDWYCDHCGARAEVDLYGEWILSDYCPNCGAKMGSDTR